MMSSRRRALQVSGAAILSVLAGCSRLPVIPGPRISLVLRNETHREIEPIVELIRPDGDEYSEAVVYQEGITVPASTDRTGAPGRQTVENVAPARGYRVRVWFGDTFGTPVADYRYYPDCASGIVRENQGTTARLFIDFTRRETEEITAMISQTRCSDDSTWY